MDYNLLNILLIILIVAALIFLVYGIYFLSKLGKRIDEITGEVRDVSSRAMPLMDGLKEVNIKLLKISSDLENLILDTNQTINSVQNQLAWLSSKLNKKGRINPFAKIFKKRTSQDKSENQSNEFH